MDASLFCLDKSWSRGDTSRGIKRTGSHFLVATLSRLWITVLRPLCSCVVSIPSRIPVSSLTRGGCTCITEEEAVKVGNTVGFNREVKGTGAKYDSE